MQEQSESSTTPVVLILYLLNILRITAATVGNDYCCGVPIRTGPINPAASPGRARVKIS